MIRPAVHSDLQPLVVLGERMHAESPRFSRLAFSAQRLEQTLRWALESPMGFLWVAETESSVVGGMAAMAAKHWASDDLVATDLALFIDPAHRGSLAPVRLLNRYRWWAQHEVKAVITQVGITTGVQTENTAQLYERMGFKRCGAILEA